MNSNLLIYVYLMSFRLWIIIGRLIIIKLDVVSMIIFQILYEHHNNISRTDENSIKFRCFSTLMVRLNDTALDSNRSWNDSIGIIPAVRCISVPGIWSLVLYCFRFNARQTLKLKSWKPEILSVVFDECVPLFYPISNDVMLIPIMALNK